MGIPPSLKAIRSRASSSGISPTRESESRWWDFPHHLLSPRPSLAVLPGGAQAALRCRCEARTAGAPGGGGGGRPEEGCRGSSAGVAGPVATRSGTSHLTGSPLPPPLIKDCLLKHSAGVGVTLFLFPFYRGRGGLFSRRLPSLARGGRGGRFCASPPPSLAAACGGDRPPRTPTPSITDGGGRRRRRASAPRPPAPPLSRAAALPQRLHRNAKPTPPLRSAPPLVCHARRLLREREAPRSPPRSRTPRAGGRRQAAGGSGSGSAGSRERPAARPRRGSPPPAPPVGK